MEIGRFFSENFGNLFNSIVCFFMGRKVKENEILQKQNKKMQKQMQIAVRPDKSWDVLLEWLRQQ